MSAILSSQSSSSSEDTSSSTFRLFASGSSKLKKYFYFRVLGSSQTCRDCCPLYCCLHHHPNQTRCRDRPVAFFQMNCPRRLKFIINHHVLKQFTNLSFRHQNTCQQGRTFALANHHHLVLMS